MSSLRLTAIVWALMCTAAAVPAAGQDALRFDLAEPEPRAESAADAPAAHNEKQGAKSQSEGKFIGLLGIVTKDDAAIAVPDERGIVSVVHCPHGTYVTATHRWDKWIGVLMLDGRTGWIKRDEVYVTDYKVIQPVDKPGQRPGSSLGDQVVRIAASLQGVPYKYGGNGSGGIDCSRFVQLVFAQVGVSLPRTAAEQARVGKLVQWRDLRPGDRLHFSMKGRKIDHCGIYAGGNMFIHCSSNGGGVVFERIDVPKYVNKLVVARR